MRVLLACAGIALIVPQPVSAKDLAPAGKWWVDFGDSHCIAQRTYGEAANPTYLLLKAPAVGTGMQLSIVEIGSRVNGVQEDARVTFGDAATLDLSQLRYGIDGKRVRTLNLTKDQLALLSRSTALRWQTPHANYDFKLGPVADLVKLVEECRTTLIDYWNGSEAKRAQFKQGPRLDKPVARLFSTSDYPDQAISERQAGTTHVIGLVDEKGELADCMVGATSGIAVLDAQTCIMIKTRGRFEPAIGPDDKPTKSVFQTRVRWELKR